MTLVPSWTFHLSCIPCKPDKGYHRRFRSLVCPLSHVLRPLRADYTFCPSKLILHLQRFRPRPVSDHNIRIKHHQSFLINQSWRIKHRQWGINRQRWLAVHHHSVLEHSDIFGLPYSRRVRLQSTTRSPSDLVAEQPPVNDDRGPVDHGGLVTQQKQHGVGHVLDFWNTTKYKYNATKVCTIQTHYPREEICLAAMDRSQRDRREVTAGREIQSEAHFRSPVRLQLLFPFRTVQEICESQYIAVFDVMLGTALI